jgi:dienelactone hydrolase
VPFEAYSQFAIREPERLRIGTEMPALVVRPESDAPHPGVLVQHGYGSSKEEVLPIALMLASFGFVTLVPDAWGHGERLPIKGPTWMTATSSEYFLTVVRHTLADMPQALDTLAALPGVRAEALVAAGFSMGAMLALILATEDARIAGAISIAGSPLPDLLPVHLFGPDEPSEEAKAWARAHDAAARIARFAPRPLLLQHGRADDMVPVAGTLRLHAAAQPLYQEHPDQLSLKLYDHTHLITEAEAADAIGWLLAHFAPQP